MPTPPELKIFDLIIEAANKARKLNQYVHAPHFQDFVCELATMRASLSKDVGVFEAIKIEKGSTIHFQKEQDSMPHPQETRGEEWWEWMKELEAKYYGSMFECGDWEGLIADVKRLLSLAEAKGAEKERRETIRWLAEFFDSNKKVESSYDVGYARGIASVIEHYLPPTP